MLCVYQNSLLAALLFPAHLCVDYRMLVQPTIRVALREGVFFPSPS